MKGFFNKASIGVCAMVAVLVGGFVWGAQFTERSIEQAIRQNLTAAGQLAVLQLEGEKMRRYEKELFIYVANPERRAHYAKEFDSSYTKLLELVGTMQATGNKNFTDAERAEIAKWHQAAAFYGSEFNVLVNKANSVDARQLPVDQQATLTVTYNEAIKAGKDRFRELLVGSGKMREAKEKHSQEVAATIRSTFDKLQLAAVGLGALLMVAILWLLRARPTAVRPAAFARVAPAIRVGT